MGDALTNQDRKMHETAFRVFRVFAGRWDGLLRPGSRSNQPCKSAALCVCYIGVSWQPWCTDCLSHSRITEHYRPEDNGLCLVHLFAWDRQFLGVELVVEVLPAAVKQAAAEGSPKKEEPVDAPSQKEAVDGSKTADGRIAR
ncbi:Hypothetical predicted protein [Mytilus galloprovincialis]|uniref:Uncharacterized protein n=1 Tax=Mytilus galloprovincialis TaxID=29158 RepID=A0A8B6CCU5_MYTGA|nr:Hypothetical predicted protein [Mytilus galloprovincialis]